FGFSHNGPSGGGYFSYWAQGLPRTRGLLLEYPDTYSYGEVISRNYIGKTFNAIINILNNNPNGKAEDVNTNSSTSKWEKKDNKWYYYENGNMVTGWKLVDGKWYYLESNGVMAVGWKELGGIWYYLNESGAMVKGWQTISGKTYYFNESGHRVVGKQIIDGKSYEFNGSGHLISYEENISSSEIIYKAEGEVIDVQTILNVRKGPGTEYDSIGKLHQGNKVNIVAKNGEWYKISSPVDGYVHKDFIKITKAIKKTYPEALNVIRGILREIGFKGTIDVNVPIASISVGNLKVSAYVGATSTISIGEGKIANFSVNNGKIDFKVNSFQMLEFIKILKKLEEIAVKIEEGNITATINSKGDLTMEIAVKYEKSDELIKETHSLYCKITCSTENDDDNRNVYDEAYALSEDNFVRNIEICAGVVLAITAIIVAPQVIPVVLAYASNVALKLAT
ncbi:MAG: SH3 domain-containing protein, partial [Clostridium perfringens]|nr:SH3 domain-containing protein [Clostridium perfringens]